jgi:hypothetical protein
VDGGGGLVHKSLAVHDRLVRHHLERVVVRRAHRLLLCLKTYMLGKPKCEVRFTCVLGENKCEQRTDFEITIGEINICVCSLRHPHADSLFQGLEIDKPATQIAA